MGTFEGRRLHLAAAAAAGALLVVAYLVVPRPSVRYGAWLVIFSVWMAWFVAAVARIYEAGIDE